MKKTLSLLLLTAVCLSLAACGGIDEQKADDCAIPFIKAMLARDEAAMKEHMHPDHTETALPGEDFYKLLESYSLTPGAELTGTDSAGKSYAEDTSLEGDVIKANYVARIDELFYNINLVILENGRGYGVIGVFVEFCTDPRYYGISGVVD